ncbi:hypothetical protein HYALB_00003979 [Hymenoscyphus albidus]|uniref:Uncharacterized protein n=1 Tax=Hymenoscyphus albidus TaxID=595503 RepID=A0A9N9Q9U3_9HELO|nr:hypothetical protein HYALB_00003979 [Hymenoscyphus albidus]
MKTTPPTTTVMSTSVGSSDWKACMSKSAQSSYMDFVTFRSAATATLQAHDSVRARPMPAAGRAFAISPSADNARASFPPCKSSIV